MNKDNHLQQILGGAPVTLPELLEQKDQRAARQRALLTAGGSLICFTMNIAGPVKRAPVLSAAFEEGKSRLIQQLRWHEIPVTAQIQIDGPGGQELYVRADAPAHTLKNLTVQIEDSFPMGRLFDMDVLNGQGEIISRETLGHPPRTCLLCSQRAVLCARGKTHSREAILDRTVQLICDHFNAQFADTVAGLCTQSLLYEVAVTPKPGLVDRLGSGAHRDMDFFTFMDSAGALTPYFRDCVLLGIRGSRLSPGALLQTLRYPGRRAEAEMYRSTGGVNTHKGAIFSMGVLCAAMGCLYDREDPWTAADVFALSGRMCAELVEHDFKAVSGSPTAGEQAYHRYGIRGIRGEAAAGFPSVSEVGLPVLKKCLAQGLDRNDAGMLTLLHLMTRVEDTNLLHRSDRETVEQLQSQISALLAREEVTQKDVEELDQAMCRRNLSPGGCADLLALSWLMLLVEKML